MHPPYFLSLCRLFRRLFSCIITYFLLHYLCIYIDNIHMVPYITIIHCHWTIFLKKKSFFYFKNVKYQYSIQFLKPSSIFLLYLMPLSMDMVMTYDQYQVLIFVFFLYQFFFYIQRHPIYWKWRIWIFHSINTCLWYGTFFLCLFAE